MENNKYYVPDIEDIHIGYECERIIRIIGEFDTEIHWDWFKWILTDENDVKQAIIHIHALRTPYLTKGQIEAEGWEFKDDNNHYYISGDHGGYILELEDKHIIKIIDLFDSEPIFYGKCPSINEFRYICKLLNIK